MDIDTLLRQDLDTIQQVLSCSSIGILQRYRGELTRKIRPLAQQAKLRPTEALQSEIESYRSVLSLVQTAIVTHH